MPQVQPWHLTYLEEIDYNRVDLVKEGANSQAKIALFKSKGGTPMTFEEILKSLKPEHQKVINDAMIAKEKEAEDAKKALEDAKAADDVKDKSEEEIVKSIKDPAIRKLMETQIAKTKIAEEEVRKERAAKAQAEAVQKAKEVPNIGAEEAKLAEVYKTLGDLNPEVRDEVFGIFKAASALVAEGGVFEEVGKSAGNVDGGSSTVDEAWAKIEKAAEEHVAKGMKQANAISKVIKENPELYTAYVKAQEQ